MARHETASSKPDPTTVANIENPAQTEDLDQYGGGWAATSHFFEIENRLIPAGTDLSVSPIVMGTINYDLQHLYLFRFYLELADGLPISNLVEIGNSDMGLYATVDIAGSKHAWVSGAFDGPTESATLPNNANSQIVLDTGGPVTADITVVKARAAFLVV